MKGQKLISIVSEHSLSLFMFYLFMVVCGFVAGTKVWSSNYISFDFDFSLLCSENLSIVFKALFMPPVAVLLLVLILAFFAGGWLFMPAVMYSVGIFGGYAGCCLFAGDAGINTDIIPAVSALYICSFAVFAYFCVYSHSLSRKLSHGDCRSAYLNHLKSAAVSFVIIIAVSAVIFCYIIFG